MCYPFAHGVGRAELEGGPLSQFQSALFNKEEIYKILESINCKLEKGGKLSDKKMNEIYQVWWPELENSMKTIFRSIQEGGLQNEGANAKISTKPELDELEIKILLLLSELKGNDTAGATVIANLFEISEAKAKYYLDELVRKKYALAYLTIGKPRDYSLAHKGREYLVKNNLIK